MNWKMTAVFGILLAAALGFYLLRGPGLSTAATSASGNRLLPELNADRVSRIEILRKGETATAIERATDSVGDYWRIAPPIDKPADETQLRDMLAGIDRFVTSGGMDPGRPETAPPVTGLDDPRLIVTFHGSGRKETIRFGKQPPTNSTAVFFAKEGDPRIYLAGQEAFDSYDKPAIAIRKKELARFDPHRVVKVEIEHKFTRIKQGQPAAAEYERSTFERLDGTERGWWLQKPHHERLDDLKVMMLVTDLAKMPIEDWRPAGNLKAQGFDEPWDRISIWRFGSDVPLRVLFGDVDDSKMRRYAHVEGSGEVARVELLRYDRLPLQRNHFRPIIVFPFSRDTLESFRLELVGQGKIAIERRETRKPDGPPVVSWELTEPDPKKGVKIDKERLEIFVATVLALRIEKDGFLGAVDPKVAHLDPPEMTLTLKTRDGKTHVSHFSYTSSAAYMRREGVDEVLEVHRDTVGLMKRLELNFLHPEIFNIPRETLREFTFESRTAEIERLLYTVRFDAEKGKWKFAAPAGFAGKEPNPGMMSGILAVMNYVQAVNNSFIGRDAETAKVHQLHERVAPSALTVVHEMGNERIKTVFYISKDQSDKPTNPIYYARMEGSPVVFQISSPFVEGLKKLPEASREEKAPPDKGKDDKDK